MQQLLRISISDFKLIFRDPALRAFLLLPLILLALIVWFLPNLMDKYENLQTYVSVFLMVAAIENTQMFCFISTMIFIDDKETQVSKAYAVAPISGRQLIMVRLCFPFLITVLLNVILLSIQPFVALSFAPILLISILTALVVPIYVLAINAIVKNRLEGMIYIKVFNIIILLPLAAYFVPKAFFYFFGLFPTFWIFHTIDQVIQQQSILLPIVVGSVFCGLLLWWTSNQFLKRQHL